MRSSQLDGKKVRWQMRKTVKSNFVYFLIVMVVAIFSYGYHITHFAIGVDDTAMELYFEEGLSVCTNRWTLFCLNRILGLNFIHWPPALVESLSVIFLCVSITIWCLLIRKVLLSVKVTLPMMWYGLAAALVISCPIMSEIWVYYVHNGVAMAYGITAISLYLFLLSLDRNAGRKIGKVIGSGLCLAVAIGCYETMLDCFVIGAIFIFMLLQALMEKKEDSAYGVGFGPWIIRGVAVLSISILVRFLMHKILFKVFSLQNMEQYGVNDYNSFFGDLFSTPGEFGILIKKMYVKYIVNAVVYLPITFLVIVGVIFLSFALYYTFKKKRIWVIVCVPAMFFVPFLTTVVAGRTKSYHSAQFIPIVLMFGFIVMGIILSYDNKLRNKMITGIVVGVTLCGIIIQVGDINKWFRYDYNKYLEAEAIMRDTAEQLIAEYDTGKPVVVVGASMPDDEILNVASIPFDSWKYQIIDKMTWFDPTIKEKFHGNYGGWGYYYSDSAMLSVLTWARNPFENCDLVASQQYTSFWEMIGYDNFEYVSTVEMIEEAERIRESSNMPGYPENGYILDNGNMLIVNLSGVK